MNDPHAGTHTAVPPVLFSSLRGYRPAWLGRDLAAGLLLTAIAVPEQLATAKLAGLPPMTGLIAFVAGSLGFAALGASRYLSAGADSTIAPIFAGGLAVLAAAGTPEYAHLASLLAIMVGVFLLVAAVFRAGWIADLMSIPVTTGFLAGIAVHIAVGQLPALLSVPDTPGTLAARALALLSQLPLTNLYAAGLGLLAVTATQAAERYAPHAPGALVAILASVGLTAIFHLEAHGVEMLGALPSGLPRPRLPGLGDFDDALRLAPLAGVVALVCMMQSATVARAFAGAGSDLAPISPNFLGIGAGCMLSGVLGSFPVNASPPRTEALIGAGGRSQLACLTAAACVAALALLGGGLFAYVPRAALAGVLVAIAIRIVRFSEMARILRRGGPEILLVGASAALVMALPIQTGMLCSIALSLLQGAYAVARPFSVELVRAPKTTIWWPPMKGSPGEHEPGVVVFAPAAPLNFSNAVYVCRKLVAATTQAPGPVRLVVIEASGVSDIDYTGSQVLQEVIGSLRGKGVAVYLARLSAERAQAQALRTGLLELLGPRAIFKSAEEAIQAFHREHRSAGRPKVG